MKAGNIGRINRKFGRIGRTQVTTPKRATCYSYKFPDYKFSAEDEKYYVFTS